MAQHDYVVDNGPGLAVRSDINAVLQAIVSNNSGNIEPTAMFAGMLWLDTSVTPATLRMRNQANSAWINPSIGDVIAQAALLLNEQATLPATAANQGGLYTRDVSGVTTLFYRRESSGTEIRLTDVNKVRGGWVDLTMKSMPGSNWTSWLFPAGVDVQMVDISVYNLSGTQATNNLYTAGYDGGVVGATYTGTIGRMVPPSTVVSAVWPSNYAPIFGVGDAAANVQLTGHIHYRKISDLVWTIVAHMTTVQSGAQGSVSTSIGQLVVPAGSPLTGVVVGNTGTGNIIDVGFARVWAM